MSGKPPIPARAADRARFVPALVLFNVVFVVAHIPQVINESVRNPATDFVEHTALLVTGLITWLPVLSPMPEIPRLRPILRCLYLFGWSILPTVPARVPDLRVVFRLLGL